MGEHPYFLTNQTLSQFVLDKALVRGNVLFKIDFVILFKLTKTCEKEREDFFRSSLPLRNKRSAVTDIEYPDFRSLRFSRVLRGKGRVGKKDSIK